MKYMYFTEEHKALAHVAIMKAKGFMAYMIKQRAGTYEVRSW